MFGEHPSVSPIFLLVVLLKVNERCTLLKGLTYIDFYINIIQVRFIVIHYFCIIVNCLHSCRWIDSQRIIFLIFASWSIRVVEWLVVWFWDSRSWVWITLEAELSLMTIWPIRLLNPDFEINSCIEWQTVQIQISWLLQKPTDLDLHCLQRQDISGFSKTRIKMV